MDPNFFLQVAPCTNNFMLVEKYQIFKGSIDKTLYYILTYRFKKQIIHYQYFIKKKKKENQYLILRLKPRYRMRAPLTAAALLIELKLLG